MNFNTKLSKYGNEMELEGRREGENKNWFLILD
jgi:hypothetical protein